MGVYARDVVGGRELVHRDLEENDIGVIADYWLSAGDDWLAFLGVDREKLGDRPQIEARLRTAIRTGDKQQIRVAFVTEVDGAVQSYSNVNFVAPHIAYMHGHIIRPEERGKGVGGQRFGRLLRFVFNEFDLEVLVAETNARNKAVHRLIESYGFEPRREWVETPNGLSGPGEYHLYYVHRSQLDEIPLFIESTRVSKPGER